MGKRKKATTKKVSSLWRPLAPRIQPPGATKLKLFIEDNCRLCVHYSSRKKKKKKSCPFRKEKKLNVCDYFENVFNDVSNGLAKKVAKKGKGKNLQDSVLKKDKEERELMRGPMYKSLKKLKNIDNVTISFDLVCPKCGKKKRILAPYVGNTRVSYYCECGRVIGYIFVIRKAHGGFEARVKIKGYKA